MRFAIIAAVGGMPRLHTGEQLRGENYRSIGMSITLGLGSD